MKRFSQAWRRYWFGIDGTLSIEMVRIAIALGALSAWDRIAPQSYESLFRVLSAGSYRPLGILQLFGGSPPPALFLEACKLIALISLIAMLLGLFTRASIVISAVAMLIVAGVRESFGPTWHHSFTPLLTAQLAFALAPAGRTLSIDAFIRRLRSRSRPPEPAAAASTAWPVLLVQLAAALPYVNAALWKIASGHGYAWVMSDSLRHHILAQFDWAGNDRTLLADLIVRHEVVWKLVAAGNLLSQLAPFVACFFIRRPRVRLLLGAFFVIETIALDLVMGLPNYHWLPLAAAFVDWDHFVPWLRRRLGVSPLEHAGAEPPRPPSRLAAAYIAGFVAIHFSITFGPPRLDVWLRSYPISQYRMFSLVRAKPPYSQHQTWEFDTLRFHIVARRPEAWPDAARNLDRRFRKYFGMRRASEVEQILREAWRRARRIRPTTMTATLAILQAPAYPADPELFRHDVGILGRLRGDTFQSLLGAAGVDERGEPYLEPRPVGIELAGEIRVTYILDQDPRERSLPVTATGDRLYYAFTDSGRYIFIGHVAGERFVIAETEH